MARKIRGSRRASMRTETGQTLIGLPVYEIGYEHSDDGKDYKHVFESKNVAMWGMPDGSIKISSMDGERLWENFTV